MIYRYGKYVTILSRVKEFNHLNVINYEEHDIGLHLLSAIESVKTQKNKGPVEGPYL